MRLSSDIGACLLAAAGGGASATAGGTGDATEANGTWVDRSGYDSAKVIIHYRATLAAAATMTLAANLQDASDSAGTGAADYGDAVAAAVVSTGGSGGTTNRDVVEMDVDLRGADQYVRAQFTPNLSASGTDTAQLEVIWVFGGARRNPITQSA